MNLFIEEYEDSLEQKWDNFIQNESINGTFLQSRQFLNYHPKGRFDDASILVMNGTNIVAVIPGHVDVPSRTTFSSHLGSTFGGLVLSRSAYKISYLEEIMPLLDEYFHEKGYESVLMKSTSDLFSKKSMALLDYEFYRFGYNQYDELSFYLNCKDIPEDGMSMMSSSRRRDCRYSLKNEFRFELLKSDEQVMQFYSILEENLKKFDTTPIHTVEEILDFKNTRLTDQVRFYGVFDEDKIVAGSMLFVFERDVLHTQYLACLPDYNKKFAMNFMDYNLIKVAKEEGFKAFSFGTSTGNHGLELNVGLALYKEGFGCDYSINRIYYKTL